MTKKSAAPESELTPLIEQAFVSIWPNLDRKLRDPRVASVRAIFDKDPKNELLGLYPAPSGRLLTNLILLVHVYGFQAKDIRPLLWLDSRPSKSELQEFLRLKKAENTFAHGAYERAQRSFAKAETLLLSSKPLDEVELIEASNMPSPIRPMALEPDSRSLGEIGEIERIKATDAFAEGAPEAVCRVAEIYILAGALDIAAGYLDAAIKEDPDHAGLWFQKARLSLALAYQELRSASHSHLLTRESDPVTAAEAHWQGLMHDHLGRAEELREQALECCLTAMSRMPSQRDYEVQAPNWTSGYGSMRELRLSVLKQVVSGAGRRIAFSFGISGTPSWFKSHAEALVAAYDELMSHSLIASQEELVALRLSGLAFLRIVAPDRYATEVEKLIDDVRRLHGPNVAQFAGPFEPLHDRALPTVRKLFFQHVDAVLDRCERHRLIDELHQTWLAWVEQQRKVTLASLTLNDAVSTFSRGRYREAFDTIRNGREEGVIEPDLPEHAYVLWRTAAGAAKDADESGALADRDVIISEVLSDRQLADRASQYDHDTFVDNEGIAFVSPLDDSGVDAFLQKMALPPSPG